MASKNLFKSIVGKLLPKADAVNEAGGIAYKLSPKAMLAQYAATCDQAAAMDPHQHRKIPDLSGLGGITRRKCRGPDIEIQAVFRCWTCAAVLRCPRWIRRFGRLQAAVGKMVCFENTPPVLCRLRGGPSQVAYGRRCIRDAPKLRDR